MQRDKASIDIAAYAKINLFLDIEGTREDGYHLLSMVNAKISVQDTITCTLISKPIIELTCNDAALPVDGKNMAHQAAARFCERSRMSKGAAIHIEKRIPVGAGLGGGSSDAAAALVALNQLAPDPVSPALLHEIGQGIGADVPFFLEDGVCVCTGIGERVVRVPMVKDFEEPPVYGVLCSPAESVSTPLAYRLWDQAKKSEHSNSQNLIQALTKQQWDQLPSYLFNSFEPVIFEQYPIIFDAYRIFEKASPTAPRLTGSGSNLFSLHTSKTEAEKVAGVLRENALNSQVFYLIL